MFCRDDFEKLLQNERRTLQHMVFRGLYYTCYPQYAFGVPDGEESIRITRAPRTHGDNGLRFWLAAELAENWRGRESCLPAYLSGAGFEPINEAAFNRLVAMHCSGLIVPPSLPLAQGQAFLGALLMYSMNTDLTVSAFAEYEHEFVHFSWESTA